LFRSNGIPLRATISAKFREQSESLLSALINKISSPDLTHVRVAAEGDNLPLMAHRIYKSPAYYIDVARSNNLNTLRKLEPGQKVNLPPFEKDPK
jgi:nucleoid-associated protein YgaU